VEFAVVLPLLLLLLVGMLNLGLLILAEIELTHAAWEAARAGATLASPERGDEEIVGAVHASVNLIDPDLVRIEITPSAMEWPRTEAWPMPRGYPLTVNLRTAYPLNLPLHPSVLLMATATSRIEYQNP
jgi:Flp pilus assembly protein TadG